MGSVFAGIVCVGFALLLLATSTPYVLWHYGNWKYCNRYIRLGRVIDAARACEFVRSGIGTLVVEYIHPGTHYNRAWFLSRPEMGTESPQLDERGRNCEIARML